MVTDGPAWLCTSQPGGHTQLSRQPRDRELGDLLDHSESPHLLRNWRTSYELLSLSHVERALRVCVLRNGDGSGGRGPT